MFEVKVTVDLGEKTVALLTGAIAVASVEEAKPLKALSDAKPPKGGYDEENKTGFEAKPEAPKAEPEKRTRRTKAEIEAEEAKTSNGWDELDDDARLEAIKTEVTKHTKKGKSADIKFLLSNFDAGRASELAPEDYDGFFEAIKRYGNGEAATDIFPSGLN